MSVVSGSFRQRVRAGVEEPVGRFFGRLGFTPNLLTAIGFAIAVVGAYFAATQAWLVAGLVIAFGAIFDLFDGALARATNRVSNYGAFLDSTLDRAGEAAVYVGIAVGLATSGLAWGSEIAAATLAASFMVSYTRAKSDSLGFSSGSGMANVGLAPREVRMVMLTAALIVAGFLYEPVRSSAPTWWFVLVGALALIAILATITTIQRILFVYQQSKAEPQAGKENQ
jgi:CDP-diacylglycerol--glycerol-3-phosphate 3-phosphatidyltransferase